MYVFDKMDAYFFLTSPLSVSEVRRHCNPPLLPDTHAPQALIQPIDHLVLSQSSFLLVLVVVSLEGNAI